MRRVEARQALPPLLLFAYGREGVRRNVFQYRYRGHVASFGGCLGDAFAESVSSVAGLHRYRGWGVKSADVDVFEYAGSDWVDVVVSDEVECVSATVGGRAFAALIFDAACHAGVRLSEEGEEGERMLGVCELSLSSTMCYGV